MRRKQIRAVVLACTLLFACAVTGCKSRVGVPSSEDRKWVEVVSSESALWIEAPGFEPQVLFVSGGTSGGQRNHGSVVSRVWSPDASDPSPKVAFDAVLDSLRESLWVPARFDCGIDCVGQSKEFTNGLTQPRDASAYIQVLAGEVTLTITG